MGTNTPPERLGFSTPNDGPSMKRIPYGIASFISLRRDNSYYVDKTHFIASLEDAGKFLMLIRPRRMGKSLLINTLAAYYDIALKEHFQKLFAGTAIGESPTESHSSYLILQFDFSGLDPTPEKVEHSFGQSVHLEINRFLNRYQKILPPEGVEALKKTTDYLARFQGLLQLVSSQDLNLYVLIDEYDNFTNSILTSVGIRSYREITKATGFYRAFFPPLK